MNATSSERTSSLTLADYGRTDIGAPVSLPVQVPREGTVRVERG